jgi:hypothetical protein
MAISAIAEHPTDAGGADRVVAWIGTIGVHWGALTRIGTLGIGRLLIDANVDAGRLL